MSRHDLISFSKRFDIIVGWDPPMRTYFAQVEDLELARRGEDDTVVVWVGSSYSEILRPEDLRPTSNNTGYSTRKRLLSCAPIARRPSTYPALRSSK